MANIKHHKFVASLPATLEADSIYFVRVGSGYDQYVTNHSGQIAAYSMNYPSALPVLLESGALSSIALTAGRALPLLLADGSNASIQVTMNG